MLIKIYEENPGERQIKMVVDILRKGGVIIYPTDTVYGMGCDIYQQKAIEKVARIKGIKPEKANFSLICHDLSQLSEYSKPIRNDVYRLMRSTLPGPYTYILNASNSVPKIFNSKKKQVGIRIPANNIVEEIVKELGNPILTTSIHDQDEVIDYTTDPELIYEDYKSRVDLVIDGGYGDNEPSTIIDCSGDEIEVIREGKGSIEGLI